MCSALAWRSPRSAAARPWRTLRTSCRRLAFRGCGGRPVHAVVRAVRDDARDRSLRPARAGRRADRLGQCASRGPRTAPGGAVMGARSRRARAGRRGAADARAGGACRAGRRRADAPPAVGSGDAVGRARRAPHAVRHAGTRDRCVGRRGGPGDPRQRRSRDLAGAGLRHRDRRDRRAQGCHARHGSGARERVPCRSRRRSICVC